MQRIISSKPFGLLDCIRYDAGTGTLSDYWTNTSLLTRNDDGTTTLTASNYAKSNFKVSGSPTIVFTDGMTVEFDIIEVEGSPNINGNDGSDRLISLNTTGHYKIVFKDNLMSVSVNGGTPTTTAFNTSVSTFNVGFRSPQGSCSLKFDNFLMY